MGDANKLEKGESLKAVSVTSDTKTGKIDVKPAPKYTYLSAFLRTFTPELTGSGSGRRAQSRKLGVMIGVFLPSMQNVFGVIMFLRLPWIVGIMGVPQAFTMVFLCCLCTLLTTLAIGAVLTNGRIGTGGPYYLISRSLGPGAGAAIGLLFCAANTIAVAMYVVGGVEIVLIYLAPEAAFYGRAAIAQTGWFEPMTNSMRVYGTAFLIIIFIIVILGISFTQALAPMSLIGVVLGITCIYIGAIQKTAQGGSGPYVCQVGGRLVKWEAYIPKDQWRTRQPSLDDCQVPVLDPVKCQVPCKSVKSVKSPANWKPVWDCPQLYCTANRIDVPLFEKYCVRKDDVQSAFNDSTVGCRPEDRVERLYLITDEKTNVTKLVTFMCLPHFKSNSTMCVRGTPGISGSELAENVHGHYMVEGEAELGVDACRYSQTEYIEVFQDLSTNFFLLMAIYFPSVTGICTGANMSGDLKDPQRSVPWGTLAAQLVPLPDPGLGLPQVTSAVYLSYVVIFGAACRPDYLRDKYGHSVGGSMAVAWLAWPHPYVVIIASFFSTFGAGIQSLCSAPKLLQSIAIDDALPPLRVFARTTRGEPLFGQIALGAVALGFTLLGKLDFIAPIVQQCFLCCYAGLNLSCLLSSAVAAPSWRPRFKLYHPLLAALGFLLSLFLMWCGRWIDRACALVCFAMARL